MSSAEESPAQRAARLRRERREAKIKEGGAARLDKITSLSGRTPSRNREDAAPSPSLTPPAIPSPSPEPRPTLLQPQQTSTQSPSPLPSVEEPTPEMLREQQETLRALLRQPTPSPSPQDAQEDPTLKLMSALMGGITGAGDQGASGAAPGGGGGLSPDLASSLGLPPFVSSMLGAATQPPSEERKRTIMMWKILHIVFSVALGIYLVLLTSASVATYGTQPPPPATARNPLLFFTTGQLALGGARILMKDRNGGLTGGFVYVQLIRDFITDGSIVLFLFGMGAWWVGGW